MQVTNKSAVVQHVRGIDGVEDIAPGRSRIMAFTEDGLARARARLDLIIEREPTPLAAPVFPSLTAKHRGGGSYAVVGPDGADLLSGLSRDDADTFNAMSDEDKATFVAKAQS